MSTNAPTGAAPTHPVRVDATLEPGLSRGLWIVKWLLIIPHVIVLAFLWLGVILGTIVAFFAIAFTGRYPRALFDFNLGVLRWSWRVGYYSYAALGTDRYPPFSLGEVPDYPARLDIVYPEQLSRGLVWVKSWLLAIPHLLLLILFLGGSSYDGDNTNWVASTGLISLLVLFAGVALLFNGAYPRSIFDFVLGLDRWVMRVVAYVCLMTDQYPPFRLDPGGADPSPEPTGPAPTTTPAATTTPEPTEPRATAYPEDPAATTPPREREKSDA